MSFSSWMNLCTIWVLLCMIVLFLQPVQGQVGTLCYFTSTIVVAPESAPAGQPIQVNTTFTASCPGGGNYIVRGDLLDARTSTILSTSRTVYSTVGPMTATLNNQAVAPTTTGYWSLQMSLYMLAGGSPVAPASQKTFGITITPYVAASTTTTSTFSSTSTSFTSSQTTQTTSSPQSATSTQTTISETSSITTAQYTGQNNLIPAVGAALVILLIIAVIKRRKMQRQKEHTRVYE
jgi:hypothetical protein